MDPVVSVIIPAYNAEKFIGETILSILNQSFKELELIIVDDGSTDQTFRICNEIVDKRIQVYHRANSGVSNSRNFGAEKAKGTYLAFVDADDIWHPMKLERSLPLFTGEHVGLVHSYMEVIDSTGTPTGDVLKGKEGNILESILLWDGCNIPSPSSIIVRKESYEVSGKFDPQFSTAADQDFFIRIASKFTIKMVPEVLGGYRMHEENMHKNIANMEDDHLRVYRKAKENGMFTTKSFERKCFAQLYKILAGSWWHDGGKKLKGLKFVFKSILIYPPIVRKYFT